MMWDDIDPAGSTEKRWLKMFALQYKSYGGPEVLTVGEAPDVHPAAGQVRVQVRASSVNPIDWKIRAGYMAQGKPLDGVGYLGYDASGVVDEVGEGVTDVAVGDDVFGLGAATIAEFAVLEAYARKPSSVDWAVAAAAGVSAETAIRALDLVGVKAGSTVLIDGGAGGVGAVAVQIALARGATVIASASAGQPGLPARDPRHPGAVRRRIGRARPGNRPGRGRRRLRRGRQDAAGRPDQPGAPSRPRW